MDYPSNGKEKPEKEILDTAIEAAHIGGEVLLTHLSRVQLYEVEKKGDFDFATLVDHASEKAIIEHVRAKFPDHKVLAEEGGEIPGPGMYRWVIDPLDGTTNYIHGVRIFGVSIAVMRGDDPVVGVVHDPVRGETFASAKGHGAYLNGAPIEVSEHAELKECLLATGFPFRSKTLIAPYLESFKRFFMQVRDIRRMGSASIDLAYVAAGRFDGFWELNLSRWDIAAGVLLVQEAGGEVSGFIPGEDIWQTGNIVASNGKIHQKITEELQQIFGRNI
ncbi:MAG: inositol monophosphatase [Calditrichaeota bacterium]|nr:MAG: inositol monophosphatase [Calditrichota bacterium]